MGTEEERRRIREAIRRLLAADRGSHGLRDVTHYKELFPEFEEVVDEEFGRVDGPAATRLQGEAPGGARRPSGSSSSPSGGPLPELPNVGPYRMIREIGRGGMGVVYLAEDTRVGRSVALKVLPTAWSTSRLLQTRFRREATIASRLDHPGICTVFEAGEEDGVAFMAMRFIEGESLAQWITKCRAAADRAGPVTGCVKGLPSAGTPRPGPGPAPAAQGSTLADVWQIVHLFEKVARALHVAHEAGLIHRDVKPGNVMVTREGEPVLLDFGLAREEEGEGDSLTRTGALLGTPAYMSPEQLMAQRIRLDRRTDLYSLGAALYECLTLRLPFEAPTPDALYQKILSSEPDNPRRLNPVIPKDLLVVLETAMSKNRDHRYGTALDMAEDLRRVREREPIWARPVGVIGRFVRWGQRNPALAASVSGIFLALAAGLGASLHLLRVAEGALDKAKVESDLKLAALARERDKGDQLARKIREAEKLEGDLGTKDLALKEAGAFKGVAQTLEDHLQRSLSELMKADEALGEYDKACREARLLLTVVESGEARDPETRRKALAFLYQTRRKQAGVLAAAGEIDRARELLRECLRDPDSSRRAGAIADLVDLDLDRAEVGGPGAVDRAVKALETEVGRLVAPDAVPSALEALRARCAAQMERMQTVAVEPLDLTPMLARLGREPYRVFPADARFLFLPRKGTGGRPWPPDGKTPGMLLEGLSLRRGVYDVGVEVREGPGYPIATFFQVRVGAQPVRLRLPNYRPRGMTYLSAWDGADGRHGGFFVDVSEVTLAKVLEVAGDDADLRQVAESRETDGATPACFVTESQARAFERAVGRSIPTDRQWRDVAFGPWPRAERSFPWGNAAPVPGSRMNLGRGVGARPSFRMMSLVAQFQETGGEAASEVAGNVDLSPCGAMDMGGNMAEWVRVGEDLWMLGGSWEARSLQAPAGRSRLWDAVPGDEALRRMSPERQREFSDFKATEEATARGLRMILPVE